ncbi:hypothetical protein [Hymenobacter nivis]|uniref:Uncharacterized protein n=1 Tax=Hymenobacter nivis TaxID=1850093 RepID=A0A502GXG2_9BACT|nr:hypothetical protein [Hymenobacter nivis]TPG66058.1 hypothetical protein EAH73_11860 [Hymenobacter nivis]
MRSTTAARIIRIEGVTASALPALPTVDERFALVMGQFYPLLPPGVARWPMSNRALYEAVQEMQRVQAGEQQAQQAMRLALDTVDQRISSAVGGIMGAVETLLSHVTDQYAQALRAQGDAFAQALAQQRTDLHQEILGSAGPLLETIRQIQALDLADEADDAQVHTQLFGLLGAQSTQLTQALAAITQLTSGLGATDGRVTGLQTTVGTHTADLVALHQADTALRTDLTSTAAQLGTTTGTANSAQAAAVGLRTDVGALQTTVSGHTQELAKRLRSDQADTTAFNLSAKAATAAGQLVVFEQLGARQRSVRVAVAGRTIAAGTSTTVSVTWPTPFPDANYTVSAPLASNVTLLGGQWVLTSQSATGCVLTLANSALVALNLTTGTLHVTATHD